MVRRNSARSRANAGASSMRNRLRRAHNLLKTYMLFKSRAIRSQ